MGRRFTYIILIFMVILTSCSRTDTQLKGQLDLIESIIEKDGEQAYKMLKGMNRDSISSKSEYARYSLLMSMAMDKNYIDITSDSIIAPAVEYYRKHGSNDHKMKALYYRGVIERNAGNNESALEYFVKAEQYVPKTEDYLFAGRLYNAKYNIYKYLFAHTKALENIQKSSTYFKQAGDTSRYISAVLGIANTYIVLEKFTEALTHLNDIDDLYDKFSNKNKSTYYTNLLHCANSGKITSLDSNKIIEDYLREVKNERIIYWLAISNTYIMSHNIPLAALALEKYEQNSTNTDYEPIYYYFLSTILQSKGEHEKALQAYIAYTEKLNQRSLFSARSDLKFMEERYSNELASQKAKSKQIIFTLIFALTILFFATVYLSILEQIKKLQKDKETYARLYQDILDEITILRDVKSNLLDNDSLNCLNKRMELLNKFIVSDITLSKRNTAKAMNELSKYILDKETFIDSTVATFSISHPQFIKTLVGYGLSQQEIGYCCLYAIGLRGKDISFYIGNKYYYKVSHSIRQKFGMEKNSTTINIFIMDLLKNSTRSVE